MNEYPREKDRQLKPTDKTRTIDNALKKPKNYTSYIKIEKFQG